MTRKYPLKKSWTAFCDILGFSNKFSIEKDSCIELLSKFSEHNGEYLNSENGSERQMRVASLCFSDNVAISIPVECTSTNCSDDIHGPLFTFFHAISFFSYLALSQGFYVRGAIAVGEIYQTATVIAGEPLIEAVNFEKVATYPRIILAPTALNEMEKIYACHFYGKSKEAINQEFSLRTDPIDQKIYFDWLDFYINNKKDDVCEVKRIIDSEREKLKSDDDDKQTDPDIHKKLDWMKKYLEKHGHSLTGVACS
jgi:hypothetical protein